jgi:amino acid permease
MRTPDTHEIILIVATIISIIGLVDGWYPSDTQETHFASVFYCIFASLNLLGVAGYFVAKMDMEL